MVEGTGSVRQKAGPDGQPTGGVVGSEAVRGPGWGAESEDGDRQASAWLGARGSRRIASQSRGPLGSREWTSAETGSGAAFETGDDRSKLGPGAALPGNLSKGEAGALSNALSEAIRALPKAEEGAHALSGAAERR